MNNADSSSKKLGPLQWLLMPFALIVVPFYRLGKKLSAEAYKGFARAIFNGPIGFALACVAAFATSVGVSQFLDQTLLEWFPNQGVAWLSTLFIWFPLSCVAWLVTMFIAWPAAFLYVVKPLHDLLDYVLKATDKAAKEKVKPLLDGFVGFLKSVLPGSRALWDIVDDKNVGENEPKRGTWVKNLAGVLAVLATFGFSGYLGYQVYGLTAPFNPAVLAAGWLSYIIPGAAGLLVFYVTFRILFQLLDHCELHFVAVVASVAGTYAASGLIAAIGIGAALLVPVYGLCVVLGVAYGYPAIHSLLKSGLIRTILDGLKKLLDATYDEEDKVYRKFFGHSIAIAAALVAGAITFVALNFYGVLPLAAVVGISVISAVLSCLCAGEMAEEGAGNVFTGFAVSAAAGIATWLYAPLAGYGSWLFWTIVAGSVVATFVLAFPVIYQLIRVATKSWLAEPAGSALASCHEKAIKVARDVEKFWEKNVTDTVYRDKTPYREFFLHAANATMLGLAIWASTPLAAGWLGLSFAVVVAALASLAFIAYLILGKVLLGAGPKAVGWALAAAAGIYTASELYALQPDFWPLAVLIALTVVSVAYAVVVPALLLAVRYPAQYLLSPWLRPILVGLHDYFWGFFVHIWDAFIAVCKFVWDNFLGPIARFFGSIISWVFRSVAEIWEKLFGK